MDCTLMHKNIPVVDMEILSDTGRIIRLFHLQNPKHLPLGIQTKAGMSRKGMDKWWTGRSIPASRDGIKDVLEKLDIHNTASLIDKCYGLSLSDQYWICPKEFGLTWADINFFHNDFSKDMGELLFGYEFDNISHINLMSPDNTSDGWLRKKWKIVNGKRILMKGGSGVYQQEPFNEVIATRVMERLGIPHIAYTLTFDLDRAYSLCENFITSNTELIPAWHIKQLQQKNNHDSELTHLLRCCEELGIVNVRSGIEKMVVLDAIISNEDRHYNNFGFIRNAETLEWIGLAPIYDSGTSLWYNTRFVGRKMECKPFRSSHLEQLKLVEDWSWYKKDALRGLDKEIEQILMQSEAVDEQRRIEIVEAVMKRCQIIEKFLADGKWGLDL